MSDFDKTSLSRRDFLIRSARAGACIAAAGYLGYRLYDPTGPTASGPAETAAVVLPDFSIPDLRGKMAVATGPDRIKTVNAAFQALGGVESFIGKGDRVLIKVNAVIASPPSLSATTHPGLVAEVVRLCLAAGASSVVVTDNPINDPESCFALTGIAQAARSAGGTVVLPRDDLFRSGSVPGGTLIRDWPILYAPFQGVNKVIGVAPLKDHHRSGASMTMKNWYGLLGGRRNVFHQDIHTAIQELAMMVRPTLVILDGTTAMMTNGPTGGSLSDLKQTNTMVLSTDQVAADAFGATLLGRTVHELPFILKAQEAGVGTADYESLNPARVGTG